MEPQKTPDNPQNLIAQPQQNTLDVARFLEKFTKALLAGDGATIAKMWDIPSFIIGDDCAIPLDSSNEIEHFFSGAKSNYNSQGIVATRAEILSIEWATDKMVLVDVRWPHIDINGRELSSESSTYVLRYNGNGELKLRVVLMRGISPSRN